MVDTQISIAVPAGTYGRVAPRSGLGMFIKCKILCCSLFIDGLASKFMIHTGAGVIDADYRGIIFVLLFNLSDKEFQGNFLSNFYAVTSSTAIVEEGDRVAQLIIERIHTPDVLEVNVGIVQLLHQSLLILG